MLMDWINLPFGIERRRSLIDGDYPLSDKKLFPILMTKKSTKFHLVIFSIKITNFNYKFVAYYLFTGYLW